MICAKPHRTASVDFIIDNKFEIRPGRRINISLHKNPRATETAFLIHGLGGRSEQWREQIAALKDRYSLVIPDLLGHFKSDKPKSTNSNLYRFTELYKDLNTIFQKFSTKKNIVIGHSYGGALATFLAMDHQDKISKLILISPIACVPQIKVPLIYHLPVFIMELLRPLLEKKFLQLSFDPTTNQNIIRQEVIATRTNSMYLIKSMVSGINDIPPIDVTQLRIPTLVIVGEHDGLVPPKISEDFYQAIPTHQFAVIDHAAHMSILEQPMATNKLMTEFLSQ